MKKTLFIILAILLCFAVISCDGSTGNGNGTGGSSTAKVTIAFDAGPEGSFQDGQRKVIEVTGGSLTLDEDPTKSSDTYGLTVIHWETDDGTIYVDGMTVNRNMTFKAKVWGSRWDGISADIAYIEAAILENTPILIYTASQLAGLAQVVNGYTVNETVVPANTLSGKTINLMNNIDLDNKAWTPIGIGFSESALFVFCGQFDGRNNSISNLSVSGTPFAGLFGMISEGIIKNLGVINADISGTIVGGGIVGVSDNSRLINCFVTGEIEAVTHCGGIVGGIEHGGIIKVCYTSVKVDDTASVSGSIAGLIHHSDATNSVSGCYSTKAGNLFGIQSYDYNEKTSLKSNYAPASEGSDSSFKKQVGENVTTLPAMEVATGISSWADVAESMNTAQLTADNVDYEYIPNPNYNKNGTGTQLFPLIVVEKQT